MSIAGVLDKYFECSIDYGYGGNVTYSTNGGSCSVQQYERPGQTEKNDK